MSGRNTRVTRPAVLFGAALSTFAATHCGSRTPLETQPLCDTLGDVRECSGTCGRGEQICNGRSYGPCQVPVATRSCSDSCGTGQQVCEDGAWGECEVPPATRACENTCGQGIERCQQNQWGTCEVPPVTIPCENLCGLGQMVCQDDAWTECTVEPVLVECRTACGEGHEICENGSWAACNAPTPRPPKLHAIVRDFSDAHPDFEPSTPGVDRGAVLSELGPDDKPQLSGSGFSIDSPESFAQWYRDVEGVNASTELLLQLEYSPNQEGLFIYQNNAFFPIDDQLLGNEGRNHNFHFTLEVVGEFRYVGGETFAFTGDDDLWVFINRRLAIDLGGLHRSLHGEVDLDEHAQLTNMSLGELYPIHIFFAERHTVQSNFTIETSIAGPPECD